MYKFNLEIFVSEDLFGTKYLFVLISALHNNLSSSSQLLTVFFSHAPFFLSGYRIVLPLGRVTLESLLVNSYRQLTQG